MPNKLDALMSESVVRPARIWYAAERSANPALPPLDHMSLADLLSVAVPRVRAVYAGEVKWSEASPGDRAVWIGRPRNVERRGTIFQFDALGTVHDQWENLWDTVRIGRGATETRPHGGKLWSCQDTANGSVRMFGNQNIGAWYLCNLQWAGQLRGDQHLDLQQMYAVVDRAPDPGETIGAVLSIGPRVVSQAQISDLIIGHPVGHQILPRQCYSVGITWFNVQRPIRIVVHLEGPSRVAIY